MTNTTQAPNELDRSWTRMGFEVELVAPAGATRLTLADRLADRSEGLVRTIFHHDTEPSLVKDRPIFHHLTRGFEVTTETGAVLCRLVDDMTIQRNLDQACPPARGSYRILSDEPRLLRLIEQQADAGAPADEVLEPVAEAFGVKVDRLPGDKFRLDDLSGATVAIVAPQGGERERVSELITPPISANHKQRLEDLLAPARALGFSVPAEAAVHVHLDAGPFRSANAVRRLVEVFADDRAELWHALGTNRLCRRLGALPDELIAGVAEPGFDDRPWSEVSEWLQGLPLTKFSDCNLTNLVAANPRNDTVEIRVLPGSIEAAPILDGIDLVRRRFFDRP